MAWWSMVGVALLATTPPVPPVPTSAPASSLPPTSAPVDPADPLGCGALVFDPSNELDVSSVTEVATRTAEMLGADLHVRAERNLDGGLDARMAQLDAQCPGWSSEGVRKLDLVVVMYSSTEREASVFYGPGQAYLLEFRWEHAVDEMGPRFASGDFTGGVVAGLEALREDAPVAYEPTSDPTQYDDDATGGAGVPPLIWLGLGAIVLVAVARVGQFLRTGDWDAGSDDGDDRSGWSSSRRRSTGWSSSSRRSFSSRSSSQRRSSSPRRTSRRSGGGTKKW